MVVPTWVRDLGEPFDADAPPVKAYCALTRWLHTNLLSTEMAKIECDKAEEDSWPHPHHSLLLEIHGALSATLFAVTNDPMDAALEARVCFRNLLRKVHPNRSEQLGSRVQYASHVVTAMI